MTSEQTPSNGDNIPNVEDEFHAFLDQEELFDIEDNELILQSAEVEDAIMKRLLDAGFPLVPQILEINTSKFGDKPGLTPLYDFLVEQASNPVVSISAEHSLSERAVDQQTAYLMSSLVSTVQILAAAKCYQDELLNQAQGAEDNGNPEVAQSMRAMAHEARKDVEAQVFTTESLGPKIATRILLTVSPELTGDSLLPLTEDSESFIMMYRLKQKKFYDSTDEVKAYAAKARAILETKVKPGQVEHPEFDEFAFSLCWAISRRLLGEQHTIGLSAEQVTAYKSLIQFLVDEAVKKAPELGIQVDAVKEMYESIIAEIG